MAHRIIEIDWTKKTFEKVEVGDTVEVHGKRSGKFEFRFPGNVPFDETSAEETERKANGKKLPDKSTFTIAEKARSKRFEFDCFLDDKQVPLQGEGAGGGNAQVEIGVEPID